jgi:hypothetical protein
VVSFTSRPLYSQGKILTIFKNTDSMLLVAQPRKILEGGHELLIGRDLRGAGCAEENIWT